MVNGPANGFGLIGARRRRARPFAKELRDHPRMHHISGGAAIGSSARRPHQKAAIGSARDQPFFAPPAASSTGSNTMPLIGSTQTKWSATCLTPGTFSTATRTA